MRVRIRAHKTTQAVQALTALCIPIACAVLGWFAADTYVQANMKEVRHEWVQALGVLAGLFIPAGIIGVLSKKIRPSYGEIIEIEE